MPIQARGLRYSNGGSLCRSIPQSETGAKVASGGRQPPDDRAIRMIAPSGMGWPQAEQRGGSGCSALKSRPLESNSDSVSFKGGPRAKPAAFAAACRVGWLCLIAFRRDRWPVLDDVPRSAEEDHKKQQNCYGAGGGALWFEALRWQRDSSGKLRSVMHQFFILPWLRP